MKCETCCDTGTVWETVEIGGGYVNHTRQITCPDCHGTGETKMIVPDPFKIYPEEPRAEKDCADKLAALTAERDRMRKALEWYGENARLCRLIHSEGDKGRHALSDDGGSRARTALAPENPDE